MSAGIQRGDAQTRLGRWWQDWRFHLSALLVLVPVAAFPAFYHLALLDSGEAGLGAGKAVTVQAGPYALRLAEFSADPPLDAGVAGQRKQFRLALCPGCDDDIRAVHIRLGKPRSLRAAGAMFSGPPERESADLALADSARATDAIWLTVERWDGSNLLAEVPLAKVAPATAAWLHRQKENRR